MGTILGQDQSGRIDREAEVSVPSLMGTILGPLLSSADGWDWFGLSTLAYGHYPRTSDPCCPDNPSAKSQYPRLWALSSDKGEGIRRESNDESQYPRLWALSSDF